MNKTTILKPLELKENLPFNKKYLQQQVINIFEFKKDLKKMKTLHFLNL
jgi:hypothetical protein